MAESESIDCPCSNIAIMQLFHELKQSYPTIPDQIVSRVIQENYHDKKACETILQKESYAYLHSYPGSIISGNSRDSLERGSLCSQCPASRSTLPSSDATHPSKCAIQNSCATSQLIQTPQKQENAFSYLDDTGRRKDRNDESLSNKLETENSRVEGRDEEKFIDKKIHVTKSDLKQESSPQNKSKQNGGFFKAENSLTKTSIETGSEIEKKESTNAFESSSLNSSRTCCSECDIDWKHECLEKAHTCGRLPSLFGAECNEMETVNFNTRDGGKISRESSGVTEHPVSAEETTSVHNYQVAVQYSMQPALPLRPGGQKRSFTTVNLSLRPPASEPQPPIEIQSGRNLTYTTSIFDAKKGVQSQLQIRIGPGGGGTVSACRTYISSQTRFSCRSPSCTPPISTGFQCQNNHRLKALLEKQKERRDLLARELRKEKEKLRSMQNEIKMMKASIAQKSSPQLLIKLKSEIERLRAECERLAAAVDLYSDTQNNLPLGETDEQFYRNIYTGQRLQREGSWSCQLCTFRNHPLLSVCEECEMPRISLGTRVVDVTSHLSVLSNNNTSLCTREGTSISASLITASLQCKYKSCLLNRPYVLIVEKWKMAHDRD